MGIPITIYVASVRAAARVLRVSYVRPHHDLSGTASEDIDDVFNLNDQMDTDDEKSKDVGIGEVEVQLELLTNREWMELGSQIVILEGAGLNCYVGKVVEIVD